MRATFRNLVYALDVAAFAGSATSLNRSVASMAILLASKVIVVKHLKHWSIGPAGVGHEDASPEELAAEANR